MSPTTLLTTYCIAILVFSMMGGWFPFITKVTHSKLQLYLSISAGVMLGASFFHVMPEAIELAGPYFGWWMSLGVVGLFCIERFIAPHSHELDGDAHHHHDHEQEHSERSAGNHVHNHGDVAAKDQRAAAPAVAGWMAVLGLTIHTFMNGVGLAGAVQAEMIENGGAPAGGVGSSESWLAALPGLAMFLAIFLHKPADALAISTVLSRKGVQRGRIMLVQFGFVSMVPIGVLCFTLLGKSLEEGLQSQLTGAALAFSAGTFLFIALSDLLPEVQFHRHDRFWLFLALASGVAFMGAIALLEGHERHEHDGHEHAHEHSHEH